MKLDPNLYSGTTGPLTIDAPQIAACPLGQIVYAGTKWNSRATYAHAKAPGFFRPTPHFLLVYTLEGEADYRDETGIATVLRPGSLVFTAPGVNQSYGPRPGQRWSEFFLWFSGPLFAAWQANGVPGPRSRVLTLEPVGVWLKRFAGLCQPLGSDNADSALIRLCRLQTLLAEALRIGEAGQTGGTAPWLDDACGYLANGSLTTPSLAQVARRLKLSYSLFRARFTALTGKSPGHYRSEEILRRACLRLTQSDDPIGTIAEELGFHDQFHFSRRFKSALGLPPRLFRRQNGGQGSR